MERTQIFTANSMPSLEIMDYQRVLDKASRIMSST